MRPRARTTALTGLGVAVAVVLAGCSTTGAAAPSSPSSAAAPATSRAPSGDPSVVACAAYANATGNPRQVVATATAQPVLGPAVALVLVDFRSIVSAASLPADPPLQQAFTELTAAVDDLANQLTVGLPAGAKAVSTPVSVNPARLKTALDAADALCAARGVQPKAG